MNYKHIYDRLITRAKAREHVVELYEIHHITPKSWGGDDADDNLVKLTLREHFIAHLLLLRIAQTPRQYGTMLWAINVMINSDRYPVSNSRVYRTIRTQWQVNHPSLQPGVVDKIKTSLYNTRKQNGMVEQYCGCGCGLVVGLTKPTTPYRAKYLPEHPRKIKTRVWVDVYCGCGCGEMVTRDARAADVPCYKHGHNKHDYSKTSSTMKTTLSTLSVDEKKKRMAAAHNSNKEIRAEAIRRGKASQLKLIDSQGNETTFWSYDDVKRVTGHSYDVVKKAIRTSGGMLPNGKKVVYITKYEAKNRWNT